CLVGWVAPHVKGHDLLPLRHDDTLDRLGQRQGFFPAPAFLGRVALLADLPGVRLKEPLSFLASDSALAVIQPIDAASHGTGLHQYFAILGSILSAHARIPPRRFLTLVNPCPRRNCCALALRMPLLQ